MYSNSNTQQRSAVSDYKSQINRQKAASNNLNYYPSASYQRTPQNQQSFSEQVEEYKADLMQAAARRYDQPEREGILSKFKDVFTKIDIDDIIILGIIFLLFNENPEDDYLILIILAGLLFS